MPTESLATFKTNIERATYFLDIHEWAQGGERGAPEKSFRELPRGAVVFAIGALDAYLTEVSAEILVSQLQAQLPSDDARDLLKRVQNELPTLALEVSLLPNAADRKKRIRAAVTDYFHNRASQHGPKAVSTTIARLGGVPADTWSAIESRGLKKAAGELDRWTNIRHQIVHQGKKPTVHRGQARKCIELLQAIVNQVDRVCSGLKP